MDYYARLHNLPLHQFDERIGLCASVVNTPALITFKLLLNTALNCVGIYSTIDLDD